MNCMDISHVCVKKDMKFPRKTPPAIEPTDDDLEFQVLDWYVPEADRSEQAMRRARGYANVGERPQEAPEYMIYMHGVTEKGHTVLAEVHGHAPYFFLRMPDSWWVGKSNASIKQRISDLKNKLLHEKIPRKTRGGDTYYSSVVPWRLQSHLEYLKLVWRKDFWGFTHGKEFPFIKIRVKSLALFQVLSRYFANPDVSLYDGKKIPTNERDRFVLYESNIDPFLRFIHERNIAPCGWVRLPAGTYDFVEDDEDGPKSRAGYHVRVGTSDVHSLNINKIAPLLIASFDIECTSSHGDFPVARKDYRKLAMDLLQIARLPSTKLTPENVQTWILDSFERETSFVGDIKIHKVYPKEPLSRSKLKRRIEPIVEDVYDVLCHAIRDVAKTSRVCDEDDEAMEDDDDAAPAFTNALKDAAIRDLVSILGAFDEKSGAWKGVLPELEGDKLIQIGTTVHRYGSDDIVYRHIVTLNSCNDIENADVEVRDTEEEVIMAWKEMLQRLDPDILTGYNIFGFDMRYMWERAQEVGVEDAFAVGLGRLNKRRCVLDERKLSSSALGDNIMHTFDMDGVVLIDMLKVMQRDQKLDSYKLDHVATTFLGDKKDDLKPREIFEKFFGDAEDRCVIARYCLQDCALVNRLMHKLKVLENNVGMGNVCSVPLSYLFMRGQGVKIFSLVAKECRAKHHLIPVLKGFRDIMDEGDAEGYEGAIVLEPQEGIYLDDPITVLDYSSLYPSSMIARNLSHDCFVHDEAYAHLEDQGITYLNVEYDVYEGTGDKKKVVGKKTCKFAQLPDNQKGIIPSILQKLLTQRKNTRKKIEYERITLADGRVAVGLAKNTGDGNVEILNVDAADLGKGFGGHKAMIAEADIVKREPAFHTFEQAVLDALQLAYKITANSLYGQIGSRTSPIYWKDIAACTTATGREMIMLAKGFVESQYGAEVVYGDSVMPNTPVIVRNRETGDILVEPIARLAYAPWEPYEVFKQHDTVPSNRREKEQTYVTHLDAWTDRGWSPINRVIRHKCNKRIYRVVTQHGIVEVTEDHSLLDTNRNLLKPTEVSSSVELLHGLPPLPEPACDHLREIPTVQLFSNPVTAQTEFLHIKAYHRGDVHVSIDAKGMYHVKHGDEAHAPLDTSVEVLFDAGKYGGYVYDIETEEGVFQAGVGSLIVKNTDSIFVKFNNKSADGARAKGKEALPIAIENGIRTMKEIKHLMPPPQSLEYEKTFYPFILFSKKRYVGNLYEDDANKKPKQKSMGIVLKRRDNATIVKHVYGGIIEILLNKQDLGGSVEFLKGCLQDLVDGKCPLEDLIITKTIRAEYKDPTKIAHKVLADRMGERDAGNKPQVNDRIPFVYIQPPPGVEVKLQGDRIEHPDFIRENNLTPDYRFYMTNQLLKPICQLYALCVEKLPGYEYPPEYWLQLDEEMQSHTLYSNPKKRKDRITALKMRVVQNLLFDPYLDNLEEVTVFKKKSAAKRKATSGAKGAAVMDVTKMMRLEAGIKEVKRGKSYETSIRLLTPEGGAVVWERCEEHKGVKMDCMTKGVQRALSDIAEQKLATAPILISSGDKVFVRMWKQTIEKADTIHEEIQRVVDTQDIGRMIEIQQMQRMANLASLYFALTCRFE